MSTRCPRINRFRCATLLLSAWLPISLLAACEPEDDEPGVEASSAAAGETSVGDPGMGTTGTAGSETTFDAAGDTSMTTGGTEMTVGSGSEGQMETGVNDAQGQVLLGLGEPEPQAALALRQSGDAALVHSGASELPGQIASRVGTSSDGWSAPTTLAQLQGHTLHEVKVRNTLHDGLLVAWRTSDAADNSQLWASWLWADGSWEDPVNVATVGEHTPSGSSGWDIAANEFGSAEMVWVDEAGRVVASDFVETKVIWGEPFVVADTTDAASPTISLGSEGDIAIAWVAGDGASWSVWVIVGDIVFGLGEPVTVGPGGGDEFSPVFVRGAAEQLGLAWGWSIYAGMSDVPISGAFWSSFEPEVGWRESDIFPFAPGSDGDSEDIGRLRVASAANVGSIVAWFETRADGDHSLWWTRTEDAASWRPAERVVGSVEPGARLMHLALGSNGQGLAMWNEGPYTGPYTAWYRRLDNTMVHAPLQVAETGDDTQAVTGAMTNDGHALLVWTQAGATGRELWSRWVTP